jgi:hypothetical protein
VARDVNLYDENTDFESLPDCELKNLIERVSRKMGMLISIHQKRQMKPRIALVKRSSFVRVAIYKTPP